MLRLTRHALVWTMLLPLSCAAQVHNLSKTDLPVLEHGPLIVWMVTPATKADKQRIAVQKELPKMRAPSTIVETTAGSFGTAASDVGQTAGSYGTPSGNTGQSASDTGQTAGSYGQTSGSFGQTAGSTGQNAGSYGQTSGSFGQTAGSVGQTAGSYGHPSSDTGAPASAPSQESIDPRNKLAWPLHEAYPELGVRFVYVTDAELKENLVGAAGTGFYPDVILDERWPVVRGEQEAGLQMLGILNDPGEPAYLRSDVFFNTRNAVVTAHAAHGERARAFVLWLRDGGICGGACNPAPPRDATAEPVRVAANALNSVLQGGTLGSSADADAAEFSGAMAQMLALNPAGTQKAKVALRIQVDALSADANERIAVVLLRAILSSPDSFGVVHALAVLRKNKDGQWKVLQLSPNMTASAMEYAQRLLWPYAQKIAAKNTAAMPGISQAAPVDGDNRPPQPDLWWDNKGGAKLQVVEWQQGAGSSWTGSSLQLISDTNPQLVTQVKASFATQPGAQYRWRVWSVGPGGTMTLSPWRTFHVLAQ